MKNIFIVLIVFCISVFKIESQIQTVSFTSSKDAFVISGSTTNFGLSTELQAGISVDKFGTATFRRSYLYFPISGIPTNAIIISAGLNVYQTAGGTASPSTQLYAERIEQNWGETTIVSGSEPNVSIYEVVTSSAYGFNWRTFNVKTHVEKMLKGVYQNQGWRIRYYNEGQTSANLYKFHSREAANDPVLQVSYYVPYSITGASINHCAGAGTNDGSINPTITGGSGSNTYKWYNSAGVIAGQTSLNITGRTYGWYGLEVTGSQGDKFFYSFIIGVKCQEVTINYSPGPNFIDDALLVSAAPTGNNGSSQDFVDLRSAYITMKSIIKFKLWLDPTFTVSQADIQLYGKNHMYSFSNASYLKKITQNWKEDSVTWNTMPTSSSTNQVALAASTSSTQDYLTNNTISFWNDWKTNNLQNYGMMLELQTNASDTRSMSFHSSDATTSSLRPGVNLTLSLSSLSWCSPQTIDDISYSELKYQVDGGYATMFEGKLKFYFLEEEGVSVNKYIPYQIVNKDNIIEASSDLAGTTTGGGVSLPYNINANYKVLDLNGITSLVDGEYYSLIVTMINGQKKKLRFQFKL